LPILTCAEKPEA